MAGLPSDWAYAKHIQIMEIECGIESKVFIPQVSSTNDAGSVISHHLLVVHAAVEPLKVAKHAQPTSNQGAILPRVEYSNLNVGVLGNMAQ